MIFSHTRRVGDPAHGVIKAPVCNRYNASHVVGGRCTSPPWPGPWRYTSGCAVWHIQPGKVIRMEPAQPLSPLVIAVEDNPADVYLIARVLYTHGLQFILQVLESRQRALHFFDQLAGEDSRCPDLLLLDYTLSRTVTILWEEGGISSQQGEMTDEQWEIFQLAFVSTGRIAILSDQPEKNWMYDYRFLEAVRW
jgi:CheY-like chemotaxis protein